MMTTNYTSISKATDTRMSPIKPGGSMQIHRFMVLSAVTAIVTMSFTMTASATAPKFNTNGAPTASACLHSNAPDFASCGAIQLLSPTQNWHGTHAQQSPNKKPGGGGTTTPSGYFPTDIQSAYALVGAIAAMASSTTSPTVAVVDAYDDPNAAANLAVYRANFGLPACTASTGCFTKVNETGATTNYPAANTSWSQEISLDLDMVSATCPNCRILLVEANSASMSDLGTSVNTAVVLGANSISNSYGSKESSSETSNDHYFNHPGVAITVSAGDSGYGVQYPAASPFVTAVGGTSLTRDPATSRGWSESVWSGSGSGCSAYELAPSWQPSTTQCGSRTVADVAAVADPNTGVAVYDTFGQSGWLVFGGTSVASPIVASIFALAGHTSSFTTGSGVSTAAKGLYSALLNKVTSGSNSRRCSNYLCGAQFSLSSGYNGPTGNGTPIGTNGF